MSSYIITFNGQPYTIKNIYNMSLKPGFPSIGVIPKVTEGSGDTIATFTYLAANQVFEYISKDVDALSEMLGERVNFVIEIHQLAQPTLGALEKKDLK